METDAIRYHVVNEKNASFRDGFVAAYQEAFSEPPYRETHPPSKVINNVWVPHLDHGIIVVAEDEDQVVGFGCARPVKLTNDEGVTFLHEKYNENILPVHPDSMWFMSELGVRAAYRRKGIGRALIRERLRLLLGRGCAWYVMRTDAKASNSKHLYQGIGASEIPGVQDVSGSPLVMENASQSTERIFMFGRCEEALSRLTDMNTPD